MHLVLSLVWLSSALSFGFLAIDAQTEQTTTLPRYQAPAPPKEDLQIGALRFQDAIDGIVDAQNKSVGQLENLIRASATYRFRLDMLSFFISVLAMVTQAGQFLHEQSEHARRLRYLRQHP
jgi:hypothetical protein